MASAMIPVSARLPWSALLAAASVWACAPAGEEPVDDPTCLVADDCDGDGAPRSLDCDDDDPAVAPGQPEVADNGLDDDCDATTADAARVELAATAGRLFAEVPVDLAGAGSARVGAMELTSSVGTVTVDGEVLQAFVDERVPWPDTGFVMQQVVAVGATRLVTLWVYCDGDALQYLYLGDVAAAPLDRETATGTCTEHAEGRFVDVALPALTLELPALVGGFTVAGPAITVHDGAAGQVRDDEVSFTLLPYRVVDCSTGCGGAGWYELHSLLWRSTEQQVAFAIVYLHLDESLGAGRDVQVVSARPLPDLEASFPDGTTYVATFTTP